MYIIHTNTSLNDNNIPQDFQSLMYRVSDMTWEEFKKFMVNNDNENNKLVKVKGTMIGYIKPKRCKTIEILIDDEKHLEFTTEHNSFKTNVKCYMITNEQFTGLLV